MLVGIFWKIYILKHNFTVRSIGIKHTQAKASQIPSLGGGGAQEVPQL